MSKLHGILLAVLLLSLASVTVLAVNKYEHSTKGLTIVQALAEKDAARKEVGIEQALNKQIQTSDTAVINSLNTQKQTLCTQILNARLKQPLCQ